MDPIDTAPLLAPLHGELLRLLRSLGPADWLRPTVAGAWRVRDVAAHLLDGDLRKVAAYRDGHLLAAEAPVVTAADVAQLVNGLNASAVAYAERLSPRQLVDLLEVTGAWVSDLVRELPPHGPALFAVSWAGEALSENWMDTGREYTERWHHQQQIRDAVARPLLLEPRWFDPLLDISVRALPAAYAGQPARSGTTIRLEVSGGAKRTFSLLREDERWLLQRGMRDGAACVIRLSPDLAWRIFYNALTEDAIRKAWQVEGDASLAEPFVRARSIVR